MFKYLSSLLLSSLFIFQCGQAIAGPKECWYGGITLGVTKLNSVRYTYRDPLIFNRQVGDLQYGIYGDIGGQFGYRIEQFRIEGQFIFSYNPYSKLTSPVNTYLSARGSLPYQLKGYTGIGALMLNGYYDVLDMNEHSGFYPYLGFGVGYAAVTNKLSFQHLQKKSRIRRPGSYDAPAAQIILGLGNYLDDFTSVNLEYHYLTAKATAPFGNRPAVNMLNITFNGAFDI